MPLDCPASLSPQAILIYLAQAIRRLGPLAEVVQTSLRQILHLGPIAEPPNAAAEVFVSPSGSRAFPWFLASTVAMTEPDRALCRRGLEACGQAVGFRQNCAAAERLWEEVRATGVCPDWRVFLRRTGQAVILC